MKKQLSDFFCDESGQFSMIRLLSFLSWLMAAFTAAYPTIMPGGHVDIAQLSLWLSMAVVPKLVQKPMEKEAVKKIVSNTIGNVLPTDKK